MKTLPPATPLVLAVDAMPRPRHWSTVPSEWYRHIRRVRPDAHGKNGESQSFCNPLACLILDDILQFYRSVEINHDGRTVRCRRFTADRLVQSYAHWQERFGASKHEVRDAVELLVQLGLILCQRATVIDGSGRRYPNRMVFEPVVAAITRITEPPAEPPVRASTLPAEFTLEIAPDAGETPHPDAGGKSHPDAGGKSGQKERPSGEAVRESSLASEAAGGVPTTAEGSAHQGRPHARAKDPVGGLSVPESGTYDSNKDSPNRACTHARPHAPPHARPHAREDDPLAVLEAIRDGKPARASPRRATPKPGPTAKNAKPAERKAPTDMRFREAGALVEEWERHQTRAAGARGRDGSDRLAQRATAWRWLFYRLLREGISADDIRWTLERAARFQYPLDWPRRFEEGWHYLSDPSATLLPWRGAEAYSPAQRALEEANEKARYKGEDTARWTPPEGYVRADDLFDALMAELDEGKSSAP